MNIFAYRRPRTSKIIAGGSHTIEEGISLDSFVIAPFDPALAPVRSIPFEFAIDLADIDGLLAEEYARGGTPLTSFPDKSTTREEHGRLIDNIISEIDKGCLRKCVAARVIVDDKKINIAATLKRLAKAYPYAFIFFFHTEQSGTWLGATPELLLLKKGDKLKTMSLAGTRPARIYEAWSKKNVDEQQIVTDFIIDTIQDMGMGIKVTDRRTKVAGPVEHLQTYFDIYHDRKCTPAEILKRLSPTPALSGFPREKAISFINSHEGFKRGYYGGFCGPVRENGDFEFYVNLRSMRLSPDKTALFVGGGIMQDSIATDEWTETEQKSLTLLEQMANL